MNQQEYEMTRTQFLALGCVAMLSPLIRLVPSVSVRLAGSGAWLSSILAAVPVFTLAAAGMALVKHAGPGEGLDRVFLNVLGPFFGRVTLAVYALWFIFYAGFTLRSGADRFVTSVYQQSGPGVFIAVMLALSLIAALGRIRALARMAELICPILLLTVILILLFSLPEVNADNLPFPTFSDAKSIAAGVIPTADVLGAAAFWAFLEGCVDPSSRSAKRAAPWILIILAIASLLCVVSVGIFSSAWVSEMRYPFFYIVRELDILEFLQRIEALVVAMWVFSDFVFVSLLLHMAVRILRLLFGRPVPSAPERALSMRNARWLIPLCAVGALAVSLAIAPSALGLEKWSDLLVPAANIGLTYVFFPFLLIIGKLRRRV